LPASVMVISLLAAVDKVFVGLLSPRCCLLQQQSSWASIGVRLRGSAQTDI